MSEKQIDGVIEAVRYTPGGNVDLVRVYERCDPALSDRLILTRDQIIHEMRLGKKFYVGESISLQASNFRLGSPVLLSGPTGYEVIVQLPGNKRHDDLQDAPQF